MASHIGPVFEVASVIEDIDRAVGHWATKWGVAPFVVIRHVADAVSAIAARRPNPTWRWRSPVRAS